MLALLYCCCGVFRDGVRRFHRRRVGVFGLRCPLLLLALLLVQPEPISVASCGCQLGYNLLHPPLDLRV